MSEDIDDEDWTAVELWENNLSSAPGAGALGAAPTIPAFASDFVDATSVDDLTSNIMVDNTAEVIEISDDEPLTAGRSPQPKKRTKEILQQHVLLRKCMLLASISAQHYRSVQCDDVDLQGGLLALFPDHLRLLFRSDADVTATAEYPTQCIQNNRVMPHISSINMLFDWFCFAFQPEASSFDLSDKPTLKGCSTSTKSAVLHFRKLTKSSKSAKYVKEIGTNCDSKSLLVIVRRRALQRPCHPIQMSQLLTALLRALRVPTRFITSHDTLNYDECHELLATANKGSKHPRTDPGFRTMREISAADARQSCSTALNTWVECFVYSETYNKTGDSKHNNEQQCGRWIMLDPSRKLLDQSRLLESKRPAGLPFFCVLAASNRSTQQTNHANTHDKDHVGTLRCTFRDVTRRYTSRWVEIGPLRDKLGIGSVSVKAPTPSRHSTSRQSLLAHMFNDDNTASSKLPIIAQARGGGDWLAVTLEKCSGTWQEDLRNSCVSVSTNTSSTTNTAIASKNAQLQRSTTAKPAAHAGKRKRGATASIPELPDIHLRVEDDDDYYDGTRETAQHTNVNSNAHLLDPDAVDADVDQSSVVSSKFPTNMAAYAKHPLYVLERFLGDDEVLYREVDGKPLSKERMSVGFFKGQPIYPRDAVHKCRTPDQWMKQEARVVKASELANAAKVLVPKASKRKLAADGEPVSLSCYGVWQTEPYEPPTHVAGDPLPANVHGNIEVWNGDHRFVPHGLCFIGCKLSQAMKTLVYKSKIPFLQAVVGFEYRNGKNYPTIGGIVVENGSEPAMSALLHEAEVAEQQKQLDKYENGICNRWKRLIKGALIMAGLKDQFDNSATTEPLLDILADGIQVEETPFEDIPDSASI